MAKLTAIYNKVHFDFEYEKKENVEWTGSSITYPPGTTITQKSDTPVAGYIIKIDNSLVFEGEKELFKNAKGWIDPLIFPLDDLDKVLTNAIDESEKKA